MTKDEVQNALDAFANIMAAPPRTKKIALMGELNEVALCLEKMLRETKGSKS